MRRTLLLLMQFPSSNNYIIHMIAFTFAWTFFLICHHLFIWHLLVAGFYPHIVILLASLICYFALSIGGYKLVQSVEAMLFPSFFADIFLDKIQYLSLFVPSLHFIWCHSSDSAYHIWFLSLMKLFFLHLFCRIFVFFHVDPFMCSLLHPISLYILVCRQICNWFLLI